MHKKLLLSFFYILSIFLILSQAAFACGEVTPPSNLSLEYQNPGIQMYSGKFGVKNSDPSNTFKLIRLDSSIVEKCESSDSDSTSDCDIKIIYSPDLPTPLSGKTLIEEDANLYLALEIELVNKLNETRVAAGQHELIYSEELSYFARQHSSDMSENHYFSHTSSTCGSYVSRLYNSGINYISAGENLARFSDIERAHEALLNSCDHKKNMLSQKYTHVGIGITWDEKLEVYCITQWFAKFYE